MLNYNLYYWLITTFPKFDTNPKIILSAFSVKKNLDEQVKKRDNQGYSEIYRKIQ